MLFSRLSAVIGKRDSNRIPEGAWRQAELGRRLVIYDRATGLLASWFVSLRFTEEADRSTRYGHPLAAVLIEVVGSTRYALQDALVEWLKRNLRACDLASHLGDNRFLIVLPETGVEEAGHLVRRLLDRFPDLAIAVSSYPEDGLTLNELEATAHCQLALAIA